MIGWIAFFGLMLAALIFIEIMTARDRRRIDRIVKAAVEKVRAS